MNFEPTSEGFLDFFKKKSKQPSRVEKSNILNKMTPGKSINYEEISQKLADIYPDDAKKEFDNRRKYLKTILNAITEVSKKYKNIPGIEFDSAINTIKCFIDGKDYEDKEFGKIRIVAGDRSYPYGTIVKLSNTGYYSEPIYAVVLDRGGGVGKGRKFLFDLLFETEKDALKMGSRKNVTFEILRLGY